VTLRAPLMLDGRGGSRSNVTVSVSGGRITAVGNAAGAATYDLTGLTLLPGFIDTHVHIGWHFDANDRYSTGPEPADQAVLYAA
jgi:imidazolonepropionase-like amidohydrolase